MIIVGEIQILTQVLSETFQVHDSGGSGGSVLRGGATTNKTTCRLWLCSVQAVALALMLLYTTAAFLSFFFFRSWGMKPRAKNENDLKVCIPLLLPPVVVA